jgi:peptide/nickel transport system permease protein
MPPAEDIDTLAVTDPVLIAEVATPAAAGTPAPGAPRRRLGLVFWVSVGWLSAVILLAVLAPVLPLPDPAAIPGNAHPFASPSLHHVLGTDNLGRDLFSRIVFGARISLAVGFGSITVSLVVGGSLALLAGFFQGALDLTLNGLVANVALAFPPLIFLLAAVTFLGNRLIVIILAIGALGAFHTFRVVRGATLHQSSRDFVDAARVIGATNRRLILREILPGVIPPVLAVVLVGVATAITAEAALAFLGFSVPPPTPTWGRIIAEGQAFLSNDAWICLLPAIVLCLTVLALNFAGDRLRSLLDAREGNL